MSQQLLLESFYATAARQADRVWMTQPMGNGRVDEISWARALDEARRMAAHLQSLGLPEGSCVAMISKNCAQFLMADLAIWMAGYTSVALYPTLNEDTVRYILDHCEAKALFFGKLDDAGPTLAAAPAELPKISFPLSPANDFPTWNDIVAKTQPIEGQPTREADDLALLVYTSGSTGRPKGVMHSFATISAAGHGLVDALEISDTDRILSYLPLAHVMERWAVETCSMIRGFPLWFAESLDTFVADLQRARPTIFLSVPRLWGKFQLGVSQKMPPEKLSKLLKIPILSGIVKKKILTGLGLDQVRLAASGSAPISKELIAWYRALGLELLEGYGMSENFCYSHVSIPGRSKVGTVGECYPGVECRIGDGGEVLVKSPGTMVGYYKSPELTAEVMTDDGFLKTGDRGEIDSAGRLTLTGRVKELFKTSKGKYVAPAPIENLINSDKHVELSLVSGSGRKAAHGVVVLDENLRAKLPDDALKAEVTAALSTLLDSVNAEVEGFEQLAFIAVSAQPWTIEAGQLTPTMKIQRGNIEGLYTDLLDDWYACGEKIIWQ